MDPLIICKSRQRAENWTREEKVCFIFSFKIKVQFFFCYMNIKLEILLLQSLLFHLMRESAPVIESKKTDKETNLKKGKEWLKVQKR